MSEVKWIKIVTDIFDDEKILLIESMPDSDSIIVVWFKLLCLAGKQNNSGVFTMSNGIPFTDSMLATIFRRKETVIKLSLSTFEKFGMIEILNDAIVIPNWGKHQNIEAIERNRLNNMLRQRKYRHQQQLTLDSNANVTRYVTRDVTVTCENVLNTDKNREDKNREDKKRINKKYSCASTLRERDVMITHFDSFWKCYPKKMSKGDAEKAWLKLNASDELIQKILNAVNLAKGTWDWTKENGKYIPYPATWLRARGWENESMDNIFTPPQHAEEERPDV